MEITEFFIKMAKKWYDYKANRSQERKTHTESLALIMAKARCFCWRRAKGYPPQRRVQCLYAINDERYKDCTWSNPCHFILNKTALDLDLENINLDQSQKRKRTIGMGKRRNGGYQPIQPLKNPSPPKGGTGESSRSYDFEN